MAAPDFDWPRLWLEAAGSAASAIAGLMVGAWKWGRQSALREARVRDDYMARIEEMRKAIAVTEKSNESRRDDLIDQFKETFIGFRRQIDDDRLHTEQNFVRKDDFRDFREEYRVDMRDIKASLEKMRNGKA